MSTQPLAPSPTTAATQKRKDPSPSVDRIDELARRILEGDILLPKFQRSFVWDKGQIIKMLDSIRRGYPVGSVLLWQSRKELKSESRIADLEIKIPKPDYPVNYLLDGQQRLSTICGALYWSGTDPNSNWNVAYDLRKELFFHLNTLDDPPLHQIRTNKIPNASAYFAHLAGLTGSDKDVLTLRGSQLFDRFKDYKIAAVTLNDMPIEDVAPIFERINSSGTPLTIVDLMRAATWSEDFDLVDSINAVLKELEAKNFGKIDQKVVLRNLSAAAGGGFSVESIDTLRTHSTDELKQAVTTVEEAYKRTVDFLSTQIRLQNVDAIPYKNQLTVLAEVFRLIPTPSADQYAEIRKWFWRTAMAGYFGGWNTGNMAADQKSVAAFALGTTAGITTVLAKPRQDIWETRTFRLNNAHAKLLAIVLAEKQPSDLLTGQKIDTASALAWSNAKEFHHFFPRKFLESENETPTRISCLANFIMLTSASNKVISANKPSEYLKSVEAALGSKLDAVLESNLISPEAFEAAKQDDYSRFLSLRASTIQDAVMSHAGWQMEAEAASGVAEISETNEILENDDDVV